MQRTFQVRVPALHTLQAVDGSRIVAEPQAAWERTLSQHTDLHWNSLVRIAVTDLPACSLGSRRRDERYGSSFRETHTWSVILVGIVPRVVVFIC